MKHHVSLEIASGNPYHLLLRLKKYHFRIYKFDKLLDDSVLITNTDELAKLCAELDTQDGYTLKAAYNNILNCPSQRAFRNIASYNGHKRLRVDYEDGD